MGGRRLRAGGPPADSSKLPLLIKTRQDEFNTVNSPTSHSFQNIDNFVTSNEEVGSLLDFSGAPPPYSSRLTRHGGSVRTRDVTGGCAGALRESKDRWESGSRSEVRPRCGTLVEYGVEGWSRESGTPKDRRRGVPIEE